MRILFFFIDILVNRGSWKSMLGCIHHLMQLRDISQIPVEAAMSQLHQHFSKYISVSISFFVSFSFKALLRFSIRHQASIVMLMLVFQLSPNVNYAFVPS